MRYSSRFWLYAPLTAFLTLAVVVAIHWWFAAKAFEQTLAAIKGHEALPGITLDWRKTDVGGFPFRIDASFDGFSVTGRAAHGPFTWTSEEFALHGLTYGQRKTVYEAAGKQHLQWVSADGKTHSADFLPGTLRASTLVDARGLAWADLDIIGADGQAFTARRLQFHMRRDPDRKDLDVMVRADDWKGGGSAAPLAETYVTLSAAAPLMALLAGKASWPDAVQDWRRTGGTTRLTKATRPELTKPVLDSLF